MRHSLSVSRREEEGENKQNEMCVWYNSNQWAVVAGLYNAVTTSNEKKKKTRFYLSLSILFHQIFKNMDSVDALKTTQQEQELHTEKDQVVATHDVTDRKQETDGNAVVEEVSLVEEEVKISAVVDSADAAVSEVVEEASSLAVETTSESQPLVKVSLDEMSSLIDDDASKGVADETNEEKAVPPITPANTSSTVDVGETKDAAVDADAESTIVEPTKTSVSSDNDKVLEEDEKKKESTAKDKLNDDRMQLEQDASIKKDDAAAAAANGAPDHADASFTTEDMDIDESVKPTTDKKKKQSTKEPARKGKQDKGKKPVKVQESEDEDEFDEADLMEEEYEVEKIVGHRVFKVNKKKRFYCHHACRHWQHV